MADHAFLSASAGDRWLHCPPSAMLCAQEEDLGSPYAQEGSDAHALCEFLLNQALGREAADPIGSFTWYNAEMQEAAEGYVSWVLDQVAEAKTLCNDPLICVEQKVDFSVWVPEGFGTADVLIVADDLLCVTDFKYGLGQLVTAQVLCPGRILLSGAATTGVLRQQIAQFRQGGVQLSIVDGALSRLSLASPTVTEAMILATGAAVSPNLQQLISRTRFVYRLINLPEVSDTLRDKLSAVDSGLWIVDSDNNVHDLGIQSVFLLGPDSKELFARGNTLFVSGAVSNRLLKFLSALPNIKDIVLIVRDFTKLFITPDAYADFTRRGGTLQVLQRSRLIAVCLNPTSPQGYTLNSAEACRQLSEALQCPVYDVVQCGRE